MVSINEEIELAQQIHKGGRKGERAKEKLVKANLRFVVSVAKQYQHQGIGLTDLVEEGNIGLIKAAEKFDETRGFKFISYAVWWIRQSIMQATMFGNRHMSIDAPLGSDDDSNSMADSMTSGEENRTDRQVDTESITYDLQNLLSKVLKERERQIVCYSFGIGYPEIGLDEIGGKFSLTRERVRQIREKAILKLRNSGQSRILAKYLG